MPSDDVEMLSEHDLDSIRDHGTKAIRNIALLMDNPFRYIHLIDNIEEDIGFISRIRRVNNLQGDGLIPADPIGKPQNQDLRATLLDAGFSRLRSVVEDLISQGGPIDE